MTPFDQMIGIRSTILCHVNICPSKLQEKGLRHCECERACVLCVRGCALLLSGGRLSVRSVEQLACQLKVADAIHHVDVHPIEAIVRYAYATVQTCVT